MKKLFLILSAVFAMSLSACNTNGRNSSSSQDSSSSEDASSSSEDSSGESSSSSESSSDSSEEVKTYTIIFDSNGGSPVPSQTVAKGGKVAKPEDPTRNGYDFVNWTYQGEEWSFVDYTVSEDMTLLANWSIITYNITYELNGGTNSSSNPSTYTVEDTINLANPVSSPTGYSFAGWTLNDNPISTIQKGTYGDLTLVANWSINSYTVTVTSSDTSKGTVTGSDSYEYNSQVTVVATPNSGYYFAGWYSDFELTAKVSDDASYTFTMSASDVSLYAKFWTQAEEEWNKAHGVVPVVDTTKKQVTYGLYPQTVVDDSNLLTALNTLDDTYINSDNGWYFYNNEYYAKLTATPYLSSYKFNNGDTIVKGTTYWFLCEPITWDILSNTDGQYYLLSDVLLDVHCYYTSTSSRFINSKIVDANNYQYSDIRAWLNGYDGSSYSVSDYTNKGFLDTAFALNYSYIQTTTVDNSVSTTDSSDNKYACENTNDKIFLPSYQDYLNSSYGFSTTSDNSSNTRYCQTTDYARARGAAHSTSKNCLYNGYYWTRSPASYHSYDTWYVDLVGLLINGYVYCATDSVRPSLSLLIS